MSFETNANIDNNSDAKTAPEEAVEAQEPKPYQLEIDQAMGKVLAKRPDGVTLHIKNVLEATLDVKGLGEEEFQEFYKTFTSTPGVSKLKKGYYRLNQPEEGPKYEDNTFKEVIEPVMGSETIAVRGSFEAMLRGWKGEADKSKRKSR